MHEFALRLLEWFRENGRDLPWRQTHDPYAIWLSEIILQQTQVKQGWAYWERFMHHWPTVEALAAASEDEVLREWQGLGYYSRARNLHTAAKQIVALGHFPDTLEGIKQLKGVGDYTADAIGTTLVDRDQVVEFTHGVIHHLGGDGIKLIQERQLLSLQIRSILCGLLIKPTQLVVLTFQIIVT